MGRRPYKRKLAPGMVIEGMHPDGRAWGFFSGRKVYLPDSIPGEKADVEVIYGKEAFLEGRIKQLISPDPLRVAPFCPHFGVCGGCTWQHMSYSRQLELKKQLLAEALSRKGLPIDTLKDVIPSEPHQYYRNRLEFSFSNLRWFDESEGRIEDSKDRLAVGFNARGLYGRVVDIRQCYLANPDFVNIAQKIKQSAIREGLSFFDFKTGEGRLRSLELRITSLGKKQVLIGFTEMPAQKELKWMQTLANEILHVHSWYYLVWHNAFRADYPSDIRYFWGDEFLIEQYNGLTIRYSASGFSQANLFLAPQMFRYIGTLVKVGQGIHVYDLYSGSGVIGLHLAAQGARVTGIEAHASAVEDARENARINNLDQCRFFQGDVLTTFTPEFMKAHGRPDVLILDPPRSGTLKEIIKNIIGSGAPEVVYVSCNPQALARDLALLVPHYNISSIQPFDMFPHTPHLETVALLTRE
ncbi:MAG: 23S rRNA (uracil(1939)-C(5))-methyltransferase RlmD [Bacteroidales bacterium]